MSESSPPPRKLGLSTIGVHGVGGTKAPGAPVVPPVTQSATFRWGDPRDGELLYTRYGNNPNQLDVGRKIAALEGTEASVALASGQAAAAMTILAIAEAGDHIVASSQLYGGTQGLMKFELPRRDISVSYVDPEVGDWEAAFQPETKLVFIEMPTNPTLRLFDPRPLIRVAHERGAQVMCDATFASPVNLRAASLGIDAVMHSATKYLGGHSDIIAGVVSARTELVSRVIRMIQLYGPALDPHTAWLLDRGLRTLEVRVKRHNENALAVAKWLEGHAAVARAIYPGLPSHPDHAIAKELLDGFGGMVSVVLEGGREAADRFVSALRVAIAAPSLGGVQTLVSQPRYTSHASLGTREREAQGIPDGFVRISVGIENPEDLIADFEQALAATRSP
jgi:cystathionine beta-lyase/cystathionine gamma-synthase